MVDGKDDIGRVVPRYGNGELQLIAGKRLAYNFPAGQVPQLQRQVNLETVLVAPVTTGQQVGEAVYYWQGEEIGRVPVLAANSVDRRWYFKPHWWLALGIMGGGGLWLTLRAALRRRKPRRRKVSD